MSDSSNIFSQELLENCVMTSDEIQSLAKNTGKFERFELIAGLEPIELANLIFYYEKHTFAYFTHNVMQLEGIQITEADLVNVKHDEEIEVCGAKFKLAYIAIR